MMRLRITTPLERLVEEEVRSLRAEDASGWFGILPGHADFLTRLAVSVVSWARPDGSLMHCAVRGGVLTVSGGREVAIATAEAVQDADLLHLDETVLALFHARADADRVERSAQMQLQLSAIRQIMKHLRAAQRGEMRL